MNITREKRRCLPMAGLAYFGGDSDSQANTTSNTEQRDMRVVGGEASQNISANDSTITVADFGAVAGGLNTANRALELSTKLVSDTTKTNTEAQASMFAGALGAVASAREDVASAWKDSQTPENSMLKIAGFVVVGIAAVSLFARKI